MTVTKNGDLFEMDFPSRKPSEIIISSLMEQAVGATVLEAHLSRDILLLIESEDIVRTIQPNYALISQIPDCFAVVVTATGKEVDFVSRFFAPNAGILELKAWAAPVSRFCIRSRCLLPCRSSYPACAAWLP